MLEKGDLVSIIDDNAEGIVKQINADGSVIVEDDDGFELEYEARELVKVNDENYIQYDKSLNTSSIDKDAINKKRNPIKHKKDRVEVDLHIEELVDDLSKLPTPLIIMGDFNADWSSDDSPVRQLANAIGLRAFRPTTQEFSTYKDIKRLDWILISDELKFIDYAVLPNIVSDHLAVVAKIGWEIHH